jgi:hypothetical protein
MLALYAEWLCCCTGLQFWLCWLYMTAKYAGCQNVLAGCNGILNVMANPAGYDCWICWLDKLTGYDE